MSKDGRRGVVEVVVCWISNAGNTIICIKATLYIVIFAEYLMIMPSFRGGCFYVATRANPGKPPSMSL